MNHIGGCCKEKIHIKSMHFFKRKVWMFKSFKFNSNRMSHREIGHHNSEDWKNICFSFLFKQVVRIAVSFSFIFRCEGFFNALMKWKLKSRKHYEWKSRKCMITACMKRERFCGCFQGSSAKVCSHTSGADRVSFAVLFVLRFYAEMLCCCHMRLSLWCDWCRCVRNNGSGCEMGNKKFFTITDIFLLLIKNAGLLLLMARLHQCLCPSLECLLDCPFAPNNFTVSRFALGLLWELMLQLIFPTTYISLPLLSWSYPREEAEGEYS